MSIRIMAKIWDHGPEQKTELLVLLALSDFANEEGDCWPSIKSIAQKARLQTRGAQKILRKLEADGWLEIITGGGRHGCNHYKINPVRTDTPAPYAPPVRTDTPAPYAPPVRTDTPAPYAPPVRTDTPPLSVGTPPPCPEVHKTLSGGTPEPSITINEPSKKISFVSFWEIWPNKVAKVNAEMAWKKLSASDRSEAIELAPSWFQKWRQQYPQAAPIHAATYLNKKRWADEATSGSSQQSDDLDRWREIAGASQ